MANSGTVTAGSAALASQYNNLRDDVLNVSTGHTHTGASEDGKKVEGSAIASTGATNGQVLAADGAGGAAFTTLAGAGSYGGTTASIVWTAPADTTSTTYTSAIRGKWSLSGGGTVLFTVLAEPNTSNRDIKTFNLGATAVVASATKTNTIAGTVLYTQPSGYGFTAGTAIFYAEYIGATTTGLVTMAFRKWNETLATNMWNATIYSAQPTDASSQMISNSNIAFAQSPAVYEPMNGIWYSWDGFASGPSAGTTSRVWIINDASGSVYSAPFGTATSASTATSGVYHCQFVPPASGTVGGTIHAWGSAKASTGTVTYTLISYAVDGTSITAAATAASTSGFPGLFNTGSVERPYWGWYDASATAIVLKTLSGGPSSPFSPNGFGIGYVGLDRTAGTRLFRSPQLSGTAVRPESEGYRPLPAWDSSTKLHAYANDNLLHAFKTGSPGEFYTARSILSERSTSGTPGFYGHYTKLTLAGAGSATHIIYDSVQYGTAITSYAIGGVISDVEILPAATKGRLVFFDRQTSDEYFPVTINAGSSYPLLPQLGQLMSDGGTTGVGAGALLGQYGPGEFPMYLPANTSLSATFSRVSRFNSFSQSSTTAATATFGVKTIDLA